MSEETPQWVGTFNDSLNELYENVASFGESATSVDEACKILVDVYEMKKNMSLIYDTLSHAVGQLFSDGEIVSVNDFTVEKKYSKSRTAWKHKELASLVSNKIRQMSIDIETGEILISTEEMIQGLLEYMQPSYWKVGQLNQIGIDVDDYCNSSETKESIIIKKVK